MDQGPLALLKDDDDDDELIPDQWYAVAMSSALGKAPRSVRRLGLPLVLWRDGSGVAHAALAACPHRGANLGLGRVVGGELECPYHGFRFNAVGRCTAMPCEGRDAVIPQTMQLHMFTTREAHGFLWLWHGEARESLPPLPWPEGAPDPTGTSAEWETTWDARLSRVVEGMMDLHHFPFAHRRYSPSSYTRLDPYEVHVEGNAIRTVGVLRPEDRPDKGFRFEMNLAFPGVIQVCFGARLQGVVVCTPVDGENTWIGACYHQRYVTLPGIGRLLSWLSLWMEFNLIQPDDYRMVAGALPRTSTPRRNHFVRADRGGAEWHRLRLRAMQARRAPQPAPDDACPAPASTN